MTSRQLAGLATLAHRDENQGTLCCVSAETQARGTFLPLTGGYTHCCNVRSVTRRAGYSRPYGAHTALHLERLLHLLVDLPLPDHRVVLWLHRPFIVKA
jgi:hypothetical protein